MRITLHYSLIYIIMRVRVCGYSSSSSFLVLGSPTRADFHYCHRFEISLGFCCSSKRRRMLPLRLCCHPSCKALFLSPSTFLYIAEMFNASFITSIRSLSCLAHYSPPSKISSVPPEWYFHLLLPAPTLHFHSGSLKLPYHNLVEIQ